MKKRTDPNPQNALAVPESVPYVSDDDRKELLSFAGEAEQMSSALDGAVTETVTDWLAPKYALAARRRLAAEDEAGQLEILREFVVDWTLLHRSHLYSEWLQIARERLELSRRQTKERMEKIFKEWAKNPKNRDNTKLSPAEKEAQIKAIFGIVTPPVPVTTQPANPLPSAGPPHAGNQSESIRLNPTESDQ